VLKKLYERGIRNAGIIALAALAGQTVTMPREVANAADITAQLSPLLFTLLTVIVVIALPILAFKVIAEDVLGTIRGRG